jgi:hypothetical protein
MLEHIITEIATNGITQAAYELGKELGLELRNSRRLLRGELDWEELTHLQKTLFLGGNRGEYERIKAQLRERLSGQKGYAARNSRVKHYESEPQGSTRSRDYGDLPPSFFDYDEL